VSTLDALFDMPTYGMKQAEKDALLTPIIRELTERHRQACPPYAAILNAYDNRPIERLADAPMLPVRLFKTHRLASVPDDQIVKTLTSSGTTGQQPSRVVLDAATARLQTRALVKILQTFLGKQRLPMLVVDHPGVVKDRLNFSARGAGILGLSNFGRDHTYALRDEDMGIDFDKVRAFAERYAGQPKLVFGFTFMVWRYFVQALQKRDETLDLSGAIAFHSGGWKKLVDEAVDAATFKSTLKTATGIGDVHDFYGMAEQVGSIFVECEAGNLHAPAFADVVIRRAVDWSEATIGEEGIVQVLSVLPQSYPGHSLLTEDRGALVAEDDCPCGRHGRAFRVFGRLPKAEARGCSDTQTVKAA
jgi:phenylacetate-coenzyme A ligase PaaK-like adenylate-forming protein